MSLKNQIKSLRLVLVVLSIIELCYLILVFSDSDFLNQIDAKYPLDKIVWGLNLSVSVLFTWFNWYKLPIDKKTKISNTFLIMFIGIIGMWIWIPNDKELDKMNRSQ